MATTSTSTKKAPAKRAVGATSRRTEKAAGPAKKTAAKKATTTQRAAAARTSAPPRRRGRKPKPDPRLWQVLKMRRDGKSLPDIAKELKYPHVEAAAKAYDQAMQMMAIPSVANQRMLERERLDHLQLQLWPEAIAGDAKALDQLLDVIEQRMKIPPPLDNSVDRVLGPTEAATKKETEKLARYAPALAAAALLLARAVDDNAGDPADVARELRISMTQLRGLAGTRIEEEDPDTPKPKGGVVVPPSRLEELRGEVDSGTRTS
jgi:hypothetical protein